jgi:methionine synthase I (cobalamin-dependent)
MSHESPYRQLKARWARGEPAVMDGGIGSELQAMGYSPPKASGPVNFTWGTLALYDAPETVKAMHRRYVDAGAEVLLTNTFMFHRCGAHGAGRGPGRAVRDVARDGPAQRAAGP